jgi:hypothetical protein
LVLLQWVVVVDVSRVVNWRSLADLVPCVFSVQILEEGLERRVILVLSRACDVIIHLDAVLVRSEAVTENIGLSWGWVAGDWSVNCAASRLEWLVNRVDILHFSSSVGDVGVHVLVLDVRIRFQRFPVVLFLLKLISEFIHLLVSLFDLFLGPK